MLLGLVQKEWSQKNFIHIIHLPFCKIIETYSAQKCELEFQQ
ncbi:hypothetical protein CFSAN004346_03755 [Salmonella enterica subsp. enterica serovar Montevideo str. CFSAN004346]|nr:hypothetical protein SEEP3036_01065 [Salmonella enterica subsp. enterica serovar Pullorum str. 13036]ETC49903.1 hypothetical protein CFSAN004346_03755 [Salmonella enterica subsp. enterica serovar Montevideo str. CFSAN004346]